MTELGPGAEIAGYRLEAQIGRGGMGVVYRATQLDLGRTVALKVIAPELAQDESFRTRFQGEWRTAASIDHPNVIPLFEAGEADGVLYIAMRYVSGTDLRTLIDQEGALDPARAARLLDSAAAALDAAHERGLVHRDVKPGNILVSAQGAREHVYLTDFGLTKQAGSTAGMTRTGHWVGTLNYVAPEQIQGKRTDARADVYALGCVLYEALTGQIPFDRDSDAAKMFAHMSDPPPKVSDLRPDAPPEVDEVVQRAMAKLPEDRFPSAGDLGRAALRAVEGRPQVVPERTVATGKAAPETEAGAERGAAATTAAAGSPAAAPTAAAGAEPTIAAPRGAGQATTAALPTRSKRPGWLVPAIVAGVLVLAGATALATGVFSGGGSGSEPSPDPQADSDPGPSPAPEPEPSPQPQAPQVTSSDIRERLGAYAAYYTYEDVDGISSLLADNVVRRNGSDPPQVGRSDAVGEYSDQFSQLEQPLYRLQDVTATGGQGEGTATARYVILDAGRKAGSGGISFHLTDSGDGALIDSILIQPYD